nr:CDP-diacylglycerol--glycerol-3-phosphate 3-phosphatidyltransferase [Halonatronomonas betaini]
MKLADMNMPNKLTLARIILIPVFVFFLLMRARLPFVASWISFVVFVVASLTDAADGYLARRSNQVTNFGKIADPLADKLLVSSALIGFVSLNLISPWPVIIIIGREFAVTGLRVIAASEGIIISASIWGKLKTVTQIVAVLAFLVYPEIIPLPGYLPLILIWLAALITFYSGYRYFADADLEWEL